MRPYLITPKLMRPSNMKRFPTPELNDKNVTEKKYPFFFSSMLTVIDKLYNALQNNRTALRLTNTDK
jgi:hypothetical protein